MKRRDVYNLVLLIVGIFTVLNLSGCRHDLEKEISADGNLILHLHSMVDTNTVFQYDSVYIVQGHRKISLNLAQMYISDIQLVRQDGSVYDMVGRVLLKTLENEIYQVGNAPVGDYKAILFSVGLDPSENQRLPLLKADSLLNKPAMWFGTSPQSGGYVFLNLKGKIDTSANATGKLTDMVPFSYQIGTDANYKEVVMNNTVFSIHPGQSQYVHFLIDYNMLLMGIQLNNPANLNLHTAGDNASTLAKNLCNNIPMMFMPDM